MELRSTEGKIEELLASYEDVRRSSTWKSEQRARLTATPPELAAAGKTGARSASTVIGDEDSLIQSLRRTESILAELRPRLEKFRKRLFEIDPVTEKPRYGPKSQMRVRLLVARSDFLCSQYNVHFPKQYQNQLSEFKQYRQQQLDHREKRQEQRRQEHSKQEELRKQKREQENTEESMTSTEETASPATIDANMNPDGSIIINQSNDIGGNNDLTRIQIYAEPSPSSILFAELQQQYKLRKEEQQERENLKEKERQKEEDENRMRKLEEEARRKGKEAQKATAQAAEEAARVQHLHQQAEEARARRRMQENARKQAEREWLDGIQKGPDGVKYYLKILLQGSAPSQETGQCTDTIDPDRIIVLESLCTLFEQIQKHPEEINKRKIKRSNPNFHQDIGRHEGGIELLVAAGFRPTMMPEASSSTEIDSSCETKKDNEEKDDQPEIAFLISKEPNLEHDMDGWMAWFDLNKATLEILQTKLTKVKSSKRSRK